jgi:hypothetical protein
MTKAFPSVLVLAVCLFCGAGCATAAARKFSIQRDGAAVVVRANEREVVRYQLARPVESQLSVESACYFHPFATPRGVVLTDVAPSDHRHHRGIFLAWVEMHGAKDADFWGWGEPAPKQGRRIVNRESTEFVTATGGAGFVAHNDWLADGEALVKEELRATVNGAPAAQVLDLIYTLKAGADVSLARWAFSGFCVRARKDGQVTVAGPDGEVSLPNPVHTRPESDWPAAKWYGFNLRLPDGVTASVAVIDHPKNPPTLWHNHRDIRMLNPCIVAPAAVKLAADKPLVLRYRVVGCDGPLPATLLNQLAAEWAKE